MERENSNVVGYYDEYLEKVLEVARLTTKDNSILIGFTIEDGKCNSKVELLEQNGDRGAVKSVNFAYTETFKTNFLERLVVEYIKTTNVILSDIIDIDGDNQFTFRMVSESNDMFTIDGISKEYALKLKSLVEENVSTDNKQLVKSNNEAGMSNAMGLTMLVSMMIIIILSLWLFIW